MVEGLCSCCVAVNTMIGGFICVDFAYSQVILSVRMSWSLLGIGFILRTLRPSNPLTYPMMTLLISPFSLIPEEEDSVILHLRLVLIYFFFLKLFYIGLLFLKNIHIMIIGLEVMIHVQLLVARHHLS